MDLDQVKNIYFLGIGGIGMSSLARYFLANGYRVAGYDKVNTELTSSLLDEGAEIHFEDNKDLIAEEYKNKSNTLAVFTPAIPNGHTELNYFRNSGFTILKRAEILGRIVNKGNLVAVAGTHGKTSVTTYVSFLLSKTKDSCNAFLGGISKNFGSNIFINTESNKYVAEADEFDRSFLNLSPQVAVITSIDSDHLEIYGDLENIYKSFEDFVNRIKTGGTLICNISIKEKLKYLPVKTFTYSFDEENADFYASNIECNSGFYKFDLVTPDRIIKELKVVLPGRINLENTIAALAVVYCMGESIEELKPDLEKMKGVVRRMDVVYNSDDISYVDDYAHHPEEIKACISSLRDVYPGKTICGIFQPHLFSRTRDFAEAFAESLDLLDKAVLLDIYPAREEPIEGIGSEIILERMKNYDKRLISISSVIEFVEEAEFDVLVTMGAGDIGNLRSSIKRVIELKQMAI